MSPEREIGNFLNKFNSNLGFHFSEVLGYPFVKPYWTYISLSHKCTYNCQMCGVVKILKEHELPKDIVKKALDEIYKWQEDCVIMFTGGEPFLREDIFELIDYSVKRNLKTEVVSNGFHIDDELAHKIIISGLQNIAISLDGAYESTHDAIRKKGAFKRAINAITNLATLKTKLGYGPQISAWTTMMKENVYELFEIIPLARSLGVECLVYHPVIVMQQDMQNTSSESPFWIERHNLTILKEQIDKIRDYQSRHGLVAFLHDPYLWLKYFSGTLSKKEWKCNPFVFINIGPDGFVRSCGSAFGNIKEMSLTDCLNTKEAQKARERMRSCQKPCLQTCWARPEADSLIGIAQDFVSGMDNIPENNGDKKKIIKEGLALLNKYDDLVVKDYKKDVR